MRRTRPLLLGALAAVVLVAAACGDDDDAGPADATTTTAPTSATTTSSAAGVIQFKPLEPGPVTFAALDNGDIDVAAVFTTQGIIYAKGYVVLEDDKGLQPVQNLVVVGKQSPEVEATAETLAPAMEALTTEEITKMNAAVDLDKEDPGDVAQAWLEENDLLGKGPAVDGSFTVGSANFSEQEIVAEIVSQVLASNGADVEEKFKLGSREVVAPALEQGQIDLYVEYVGAYLAYLGGTPTGNLESSLADLRAAAEAKGIVVFDPAPAEDKDGLAVTKETASTYGLAKISDLATVTDTLVLGAPPECPERPFCIQGYQQTYGLQFDV